MVENGRDIKVMVRDQNALWVFTRLRLSIHMQNALGRSHTPRLTRIKDP